MTCVFCGSNIKYLIYIIYIKQHIHIRHSQNSVKIPEDQFSKEGLNIATTTIVAAFQYFFCLSLTADVN